jgi:hypothetical protein
MLPQGRHRIHHLGHLVAPLHHRQGHGVVVARHGVQHLHRGAQGVEQAALEGGRHQAQQQQRGGRDAARDGQGPAGIHGLRATAVLTCASNWSRRATMASMRGT